VLLCAVFSLLAVLLLRESSEYLIVLLAVEELAFLGTEELPTSAVGERVPP
jgi:hypothetical protein